MKKGAVFLLVVFLLAWVAVGQTIPPYTTYVQPYILKTPIVPVSEAQFNSYFQEGSSSYVGSVLPSSVKNKVEGSYKSRFINADHPFMALTKNNDGSVTLRTGSYSPQNGDLFDGAHIPLSNSPATFTGDFPIGPESLLTFRNGELVSADISVPNKGICANNVCGFSEGQGYQIGDTVYDAPSNGRIVVNTGFDGEKIVRTYDADGNLIDNKVISSGETCTDEPLDPIEDANGNPVEPSTTDDTSGDSSSTDSTSDSSSDEIDENTQTTLETPIRENGELNVRGEESERADKFAEKMNCIVDDDEAMDSLMQGFTGENGFGSSEENMKLWNDIWSSDKLGEQAKQKFMDRYVKDSLGDNFKFDGGGNLEGSWGGIGDSADFTPEGFKGPIGLPQIKQYNFDKKSRDYTSVNTGNKKTESFQELTGVSLENGVLKYIYDNGKGKTVSIAQGSETTFDASKNELTLKDGRKAEVWGKGAITVGKDGSVDFGFDHDGENLRTGRVKIGDNFYGSSMWPIQEPVNFPEGFQKPSQKGTYTYHKDGNRLFSVDSDGVVREFQSSKLLPTTEKDVPKMVGGFTSGEAGLYFASSDTSGTAINWNGKPTDGNMFAYDSSKKNLFIRSQGDSWFTQRQNLNEVKLEGGALLQNGNALAIVDPNGHTYFREVLNQEGEPFHSIATLNEGWKITPNEQGGIEIQDPEGTVRSYSGSLEEISQAPPRPSARPGQPPSRTPPTTTPPTQNPPTDTTPPENNPPVDTTPPSEGNDQKIQIATQTVQSSGYTIQSRDSLVAYSGNNQQMTLPSDIPRDAVVMVSGVNCPPCKTFKNNNGLQDGYNPEKNIYVITQSGNFGGVPRFYGASP